MEGTALVMILTPILAPLAAETGLDPVHFGVLFVMNLNIGLATPPFGLCLFMGCAIGGTKIEKVAKAVLPFVAAEIVILGLCAYVPAVVLFVPKLLGFIR